MKTEFPRILTGSKLDCLPNPAYAIVHATKTCHRRITGQPNPQDPGYLSLVHNGELYLNMVDPPLPLFQPEMFDSFLQWSLPCCQAGQTLLIHCDQGNSRSRTLVLLLAAHIGILPTESYYAAAAMFEEMTQTPYSPGAGLCTFMDQRWHRLLHPAEHQNPPE